MIAKTVEIRDRGTFIPALAVKMEPAGEADRYLLARAGYGTTPMDQAQYIVLVQITGGTGHATSDPYDWPGGARTYPTAHNWLIDHFDEIESGAVIDVEYLLAERLEPKLSERVTK